jgi:hypothetical protein
MTKFQEDLKQAIYDVYRMKPVSNNEDVKHWKEQHEKAQLTLNLLIERAVDIQNLDLSCRSMIRHTDLHSF